MKQIWMDNLDLPPPPQWHLLWEAGNNIFDGLDIMLGENQAAKWAEEAGTLRVDDKSASMEGNQSKRLLLQSLKLNCPMS